MRRNAFIVLIVAAASLPRLAIAQDSITGAGQSPRLRLAEPQADRTIDAMATVGPSPPRVSRSGRVLAEVGVGIGTVALAVGVSIGLAAIGCQGSSHESGMFGSAYGWCVGLVGIAIAAPSALLLLPLGVTLIGNAMHGNGGYGWALLGTALGVLAAVVTFGLLAPIAPFAGAILGYELSSVGDRRHPESAERERGRDRPALIRASVAVSPRLDAMTVGLAGSF